MTTSLSTAANTALDVDGAHPLTVLVVGAHPDDIELGATALVHRLAEHERVDLWLLVLTDDEESDIRRREAITSAELLGVDESRVLFAGFPDGRLHCSRDTIGAIRSLLGERGIAPDVAVTHTRWDSHNDHRNAAEIVQSALRGALLLQYGIRGSLEQSHFHPTVFVDASDVRELREKALATHVSQAARMPRFDSVELLERYGPRLGVELAEGYSVIVQSDAHRAREFLDLIDDRPFERLWRHLAPDHRMTLLYGMQVPERRAYTPFDGDHERRATTALVQRLRLGGGSSVGVDEISSFDEASVDALFSGSVILAGGPVSNRVVRDYYNRFAHVSHRVDFDMPGYSARRVIGPTGATTSAEVRDGSLVVDVGLLSVVPNPCCPGASIVAAMGAFGPATARALELLTEPTDELVAEIVAAMDGGFPFEQPFEVALEPAGSGEPVDGGVGARPNGD